VRVDDVHLIKADATPECRRTEWVKLETGFTGDNLNAALPGALSEHAIGARSEQRAVSQGGQLLAQPHHLPLPAAPTPLGVNVKNR
jgi:hypothetical protein